ncbi:MAG: ATP-dependent nuclease [Bacteroidales bacterium]
MHYNDLVKIAKAINTNYQPITMTKRDFVNAFGFEKRTKGNCSSIDDFLNMYHLQTLPIYKHGWIDETMVLSHKYSILSQNFMLYTLYIKDYKNLKNINLDFQSKLNYATIIGLNGSGKSNVLEAISLIFYSLYHLATLGNQSSYNCPFKYEICYIINGKFYKIINGKLHDGSSVTIDILPKNIIASYSGEDTRLWEKSYKLIYDRFCSKLTAEQGFTPPYLFYIDKKQWEIAMLVLFYSEDVDVVRFITSILGEMQCKITFEYEDRYFSNWEGTPSLAFVNKLRENTEYTVESFRNVVNEISFIDQSSTLYYFLFRTSTGENNRLISRVNIEFENKGRFEGMSEGEKKMILANLIIHILSDKNSLCLFDEPDSHIHVSRKTELLELINSPNRYSIITTHSPIFTSKMNPKNIIFINKGKLEDFDKIKKLNQLTGGEISYIDGAFIASSKKIVITEGTYDIKYIKKAIDVFSKQDINYKKLNELSFIPQGSADNTESFYNDIVCSLVSNATKILYVYDYDNSGKIASKKIKQLNNEKISSIYYNLDYNTQYNEQSNHFYIEDLFDPECYKSVIEESQRRTKYCDFKNSNTGKLDKKIKEDIEKYYNSFDDNIYNNFQPLLDKLLTEFSL